MGHQTSTPPSPRELVATVYDELVATLRADMVAKNILVQSLLVVVSPSECGFILVMDPATHRTAIRDALASTPAAVGWVFVYDGHILMPAIRQRREALLCLRGTLDGELYGRAFTYMRTTFGAQFDPESVEPPATLLKDYRSFCCPPTLGVVPTPSRPHRM